MKRVWNILLWLAMAQAGFSQSWSLVPYGGKWQYLSTRHFKILYESGYEPLALRTAAVAEFVHQRLTPFLKWQPRERTRIIILDNTDQANAISTPFPKNTIIVYPTLPHGQPDNYLDWLYELLLHEYTHILQMDMATGFMGDLRQVFGRVVLPNAIQPLHHIEGLAVYAETEFSSMGRNNSALTEGILRTAAHSDNWPSLDRVTAFNSRWPWDAPYLYGGAFAKYLADSFGQGSLADYHLRHAGLLIPLLPNRPARTTFGTNLGTLWKKFSDRKIREYRQQLDAIKSEGLPEMSPITNNGFYKSSLAISPDGSSLVYFQSDGRSHSAIMMKNLATKEERRLYEGLVDGAIAFGPEGRSLIFGELDYRRDGRELSCDLYRLDLVGGMKTRLTKNLRARDPAPSPDGRFIFFVVSKCDGQALCRLNLKSKGIDTLFGLADSVAFDRPQASPQGRLLAFSARTGQGYQDIYIYDLETGECRPITMDQAADIHPSWSSDGQHLFFSSDRSGIWNIYVYHLQDRLMEKLTHEIGGAFWPQVRDSCLWAISLTGRGYELARMDLSATEPGQPVPYHDGHYSYSQTEVKVDIAGARRYCFWETLAPVAWLPTGFIDSDGGHWGAILFGADDLMRHYYLFSLAPNIQRRTAYYDLQYYCRSYPADINFDLYNYNILRNSTAGSDYYEARRGQSLAFSKTFLSVKRQFAIGLGYSHRNISSASRGAANTWWWTGDLAEIYVWADYRDAQRYPLSISPERGRIINLASRFYSQAFGGDIDQIWLQAGWAEYLALPWDRQVLMLLAKAGQVISSKSFLDEFQDEFQVRGEGMNLPGRTKIKTTLEYRFPLKRLERGASLWPFFLHALHGAIFMEAASGGQNFYRFTEGPWRKSLGLELRSDWTLFYGLKTQARLGLAKPLRPGSGCGFYLNFDLPLGLFHNEN